MENPELMVRSVGVVQGERIVCQHIHKVDSRGVWFGDNIFDYSFPVLMAEIILIFVVSWSTYFLLRPLRQTRIITQIIAGIIIGPSLLGRYKAYMDTIFPPGCRLVLSTFAELGAVLHFFVVGAQVDASQLKRIGKKPMLIGLTGFMVAFAFGGFAVKIVHYLNASDSEDNLGVAVSTMVAVNSMTSLVVTTDLLKDLNILNSQLGRLASSTSMISDACGWFSAFILSNILRSLQNSTFKPLLTATIVLGYYCVLFFVLRPLAIWFVNHTPEGRIVKESHFIAILCLVLLNGFIAEYVGQHAGFCSFVFALSLPNGPPLGEILTQKLGTIGTGLLFPIYCAIAGLRANIAVIEPSSASLALIIVAGYIGKFTGTILPSLYFGNPFRDSLTLALIMCCRGAIELAIYSLWKDMKIVDRSTFSLLLISMVVVTGIATPVISNLYDPSRRYTAHTGGTLLNSKQNNAFGVLVCIHNEDNVYPIINLLETSYPTKENITSVFVLHLVELSGRAAAILIRHKKTNSSTSKVACSQHIANAFNQYERYSHGCVAVHHFTAFAPYVSMHDDICSLAMEEKTSVIILPFHKRWAIDGRVEASFAFIRIINRQVIQKAPCSVAVLVDRSEINGKRSISTAKSYRIAMLFLGGADDREALQFGIRMANHPKVSLTVIWFKPDGRYPHSPQNNADCTQVMDDLGASALGKEKITCKMEIVKDGADTTYVIRMLEDAFDLVLVGKRQEPKSPATLGLTEWSECPELGVLGDMLASSDFRFSVLVVQQHQKNYNKV